jgi:beta-mannanase
MLREVSDVTNVRRELTRNFARPRSTGGVSGSMIRKFTSYFAPVRSGEQDRRDVGDESVRAYRILNTPIAVFGVLVVVLLVNVVLYFGFYSSDTTTPLPLEVSRPLEKFEPADGQVYDGVDANQQAGDTVAVSTQRWADYSNNVLGGEEPLISHTFTGYDTDMSFDTDIATARGAVPLITWQTGSSISPKTIANGGATSSGKRSDYVILRVASDLRTYSKPTFLRIDQEMNAYWFAWCAYNSDGTPRANTTEDFKDMWRRMHIIFEGGTVSEMNSKLAAQGMPPLDPQVGTSAASKGLSSTTDPDAYLAPTNNVAFVFNPVDAPGIPNKAGNRWADYYPGDKYVDWVGQTSYDSTWNATLAARIGWLEQFYQEFAVGHNKPYMMGEWGLTQDIGDDPAYIERMLDWQKDHPRVKALVYFNVKTTEVEHRLEVYPNSAALMRADAPRYLDEVRVR